MSIEALKEKIPDYAKDLRLNLSAIYSNPLLNDQQKAGCFITAALTSRNKVVIEHILADFSVKISTTVLQAAQTASALMGMNNIYYRFTHLVENEHYRQMPAKLRMNGIMTHGIEKADFELFCLVASAINGCAACLNAHEHELRKLSVSEEAIQESVKIGAVVHAIAGLA